MQHVELGVPEGHPLIKLKKLRLRDLKGPAFYDRLIHECSRGCLKSQMSVQGSTSSRPVSINSCTFIPASVSRFKYASRFSESTSG